MDHEFAKSKSFKIGHQLILQVEVWTDAPDGVGGRTFGFRLTVAKYLNIAGVLGNLGF